MKLASATALVAAALVLGAPAAAQTKADLLAKRSRDCPGCDLTDAKLKRYDLSGANLAGAILTGANFHGAKLAGADLSGA